MAAGQQVDHALNNIGHISGSIGNWVEAVDLDQSRAAALSSALYKRTESIKDGVKTVVDYDVDPVALRRRKITSQYKVVTKTVPKCVAKRRSWVKFGQSAGDGPGPQNKTTYVADEVKVQFVRNRQGEALDTALGDQLNIELERKSAGAGGRGQHCRFCKSDDHWSVNCPYKEMYQQAYTDDPSQQPGMDAAGGAVPFPPNFRQPPPLVTSGGGAAGGGSGGRYVNPFARGDRQMSSAGMGVGGDRRADDFTCRVTNLPEDSETLDEDLRAMFSSVGRIERFYLARDKATNKPKGFAFITFSNHQDAERAIDRFNGWKMEHLILKVEWTKPQN